MTLTLGFSLLNTQFSLYSTNSNTISMTNYNLTLRCRKSLVADNSSLLRYYATSVGT